MELRLKEQEHQRSVAELKIKELELKLKEQEHQRSVAELKVSPLKMLCYRSLVLLHVSISGN